MKNEIKNLILSSFDRFLGEMAPYWTKDNFKKLIEPKTLTDQEVLEVLKEMVVDDIIYWPKDETYYVVLKEKYIKMKCSPNSEMTSYILKQINNVEEKLQKLNLI